MPFFFKSIMYSSLNTVYTIHNTLMHNNQFTYRNRTGQSSGSNSVSDKKKQKQTSKHQEPARRRQQTATATTIIFPPPTVWRTKIVVAFRSTCQCVFFFINQLISRSLSLVYVERSCEQNTSGFKVLAEWT